MNTSLSIKKNTLRGLHYQKIPKTESKLVRCIKGSIFDVIVDLRFGSKTYGEWTSCELSDKNRDMIYIPDGFAHGYMTTSDNTEIIYNVSEFYDEEYEGSICWNDSNLDIDWPHKPISISKKDKEAKTIKELEPIKL